MRKDVNFAHCIVDVGLCQEKGNEARTATEILIFFCVIEPT